MMTVSCIDKACVLCVAKCDQDNLCKWSHVVAASADTVFVWLYISGESS